MAAELEKQKELDDRLLQAETDEDRATMNRIVGDYGEKIQVFFSFLFFSFFPSSSILSAVFSRPPIEGG